jgi:metal-sulfur cluster biosynthetic enzyme
VHAALGRVVDPCSIATGVPINLADMGLVSMVEIDEGAVYVQLRLTSPVCLQAGNIVAAVEERVAELDWVCDVRCDIDHAAEWMPEMMSEGARGELRRRRPAYATAGSR